MKALKYTIVKDRRQYYEYCNKLEALVLSKDENQDEVALLNLLIEKWDEDHNILQEPDPIALIKVLMNEHHMKPKDLMEVLNLSKSTVSKILNYHKGLSKNTIRKLSSYFKVSQDCFNRPYTLKSEGKNLEKEFQ